MLWSVAFLVEAPRDPTQIPHRDLCGPVSLHVRCLVLVVSTLAFSA